MFEVRALCCLLIGKYCPNQSNTRSIDYLCAKAVTRTPSSDMLNEYHSVKWHFTYDQFVQHPPPLPEMSFFHENVSC